MIAAGLEGAEQSSSSPRSASTITGQAGITDDLARAHGPHQPERLAPLSDGAEHEQCGAVVAELESRLVLGLGAGRLLAGGQIVEQERARLLVALGDEKRCVPCIRHSFRSRAAERPPVTAAAVCQG